LKENTVSYQKIFRFPGLCENQESIKKVEDTGYKIINGDVYGEDGFQKNPKVIIHNVLSQVKNGSVIILHMHGGPIAPATAPALHEIIHELKKENFTFEKI
jgi:peptidoglycan/xylan/chitin deacetylase (PgdA/CDA1 family)